VESSSPSKLRGSLGSTSRVRRDAPAMMEQRLPLKLTLNTCESGICGGWPGVLRAHGAARSDLAARLVLCRPLAFRDFAHPLGRISAATPRIGASRRTLRETRNASGGLMRYHQAGKRRNRPHWLWSVRCICWFVYLLG